MTWQDLWAKATEVQEAAAAAAEVENSRFRWATAGDLSVQSIVDDPRSVGAVPPSPHDLDDMDAIERVPSYFGWLAYRDPAELDGKAEALFGAYDRFCGACTAHSGGDAGLDRYRGRLVVELSGYLDTMDDVADRHSELALELHVAIRNVQRYLTTANEDLVELADRAIDALDDIVADGDGDAVPVATALAGLRVGVTGAEVPDEAPMIPFGLLTRIVAENEPPAHGEVIGAPSVAEVLRNLFDAVDERRERLAALEDELIAVIDADDTLVTDNGERLEPRRPGMSDDRGDLAPGSDGDGLLTDLARLQYYAREEMSRMAGDLAAANRSVTAGGSAGGAAALGEVSDPWHRLCGRLQTMSGRISRNIFDAADVVVAAITDFAERDGITAADLARRRRQLVGDTD